ncbi:hypothetical protein NQ318_022453 [Aromia moschata]|uniref:Uncharacterized protein n=1 Tax=Aromia moschata TaxID=1265417 RepID=A0AAV8Z7J5_9CUCU|nr:hypothetical protein NQ318_022453 [Aromia moschata]
MSESTAEILRRQCTSGPHGLGDPDDLSLRKVEKDVLIPKKMRDIARTQKCVQEVAEFSECCKRTNFPHGG